MATQNGDQYPLQHLTYAATKFEVATANSLGGDTITRNGTDGQRTDFGTKLIYLFSKAKSRYNNLDNQSPQGQ